MQNDRLKVLRARQHILLVQFIQEEMKAPCIGVKVKLRQAMQQVERVGAVAGLARQSCTTINANPNDLSFCILNYSTPIFRWSFYAMVR